METLKERDVIILCFRKKFSDCKVENVLKEMRVDVRRLGERLRNSLEIKCPLVIYSGLRKQELWKSHIKDKKIHGPSIKLHRLPMLSNNQFLAVKS